VLKTKKCRGLENKCSCFLCLTSCLKKYTRGTIRPAATSIVKRYGRDPFLILVSCVLSLRTRDSVSLPASIKLFEKYRTPQDFVQACLSDIEQLIFPVGFYRQKAAQIKKLSSQLIHDFNNKVPATKEELLSLSGVGLKTANLVLGVGFNVPAICVDTHVHRLSNQWGLVSTDTPEETEHELKKIIPQDLWIEINEYMVMWGQFMCKSNTQVCTKCKLLNVLCVKEKRTKKTTRV